MSGLPMSCELTGNPKQYHASEVRDMSKSHDTTRLGPHAIDLTGQIFGDRIVLRRAASKDRGSRAALWICRCKCGSEQPVQGSQLRVGKAPRCVGCTNKLKEKLVHRRESPERKIWRAILSRCYDPKDKSYARYGGRGITVCDEWRKPHFGQFLKDMGRRPEGKSKNGLALFSIERRDNTLGYFKENCYWATWQEQARNRRDNLFLTFNGETLTLSEWSRKTGINHVTILKRLRVGWPVEKALTVLPSEYDHNSRRKRYR